MSALGDNAARWMAWLTSKGGPFDVGYSQPRRFSPEIHAAIADGGGVADMDCSSGVALAYNAGGLTPPFPEDDRTWTGSLRELAGIRGFTVMDWDEVGPHAENLLPGDLLLSERDSGGVGHVAMALWGDAVGEAWVDSQGSDGWDDPGEPAGDQTGAETRQIAYSSHPYTVSGRWTHVLRYAGDEPTTTPSQSAEELPVHVIIAGQQYDAADVIAAMDQRIVEINKRTIGLEQRQDLIIAKLAQIADRVGRTGNDAAATRAAAESTAAVVSGRGIDLADGTRTDLGAALRDELNEKTAAAAAGI